MKTRKRILALILCVMIISVFGTGCGRALIRKNQESKEEVVNLIWYQIGDPQKDLDKVLEKVNEYTKEKIGVSVQIIQIGWNDYNKRMQIITNAGEVFDLEFTSSWTNNYLTNAQRGVFVPLDELLPEYGKEMYESIDKKFWEAAKVDGKIYGVPNEKEIGNMPMWVFTKEYVDKYDIPYQDIHSLEDLEPWLKIIKENEPDVIPLYITRDYSAPTYMDKIQDPIGVEYDDTTLTVKNLFETEKMRTTLQTMRKYYIAGYINEDAATATDNKAVKRFVTKGDGQPYAELIWSKDLGYDVVASSIMDIQITNASARGSITAISKTSKYPKKALMLLNLINSDEYLRNLLNYGIEGIHYEKVELSEEDKALVVGKDNIYNVKVKLNTSQLKNYSVPYWVQGGLFNTYVLQTEPADKWDRFRKFNDNLQPALSFGFDFNSSPVLKEISEIKNVLDEFGPTLYSGSVDPEEYIPKLNKKLESININAVIDEIQNQIDEWKKSK